MNKYIYKCKYILIVLSVYFSDDILFVMVFRVFMFFMLLDDLFFMFFMLFSFIMVVMLVVFNMGLEDWEDVEEEFV